MSLCYARKFDGRKYDPRADAADLAYTNLTDYLVQVRGGAVAADSHRLDNSFAVPTQCLTNAAACTTLRVAFTANFVPCIVITIAVSLFFLPRFAPSGSRWRWRARRRAPTRTTSPRSTLSPSTWCAPRFPTPGHLIAVRLIIQSECLCLHRVMGVLVLAVPIVYCMCRLACGMLLLADGRMFGMSRMQQS